MFDIAQVTSRADQALAKNQSNPEGKMQQVFFDIIYSVCACTNLILLSIDPHWNRIAANLFGRNNGLDGQLYRKQYGLIFVEGSIKCLIKHREALDCLLHHGDFTPTI